jgi:type IV secretion system protein TrbL
MLGLWNAGLWALRLVLNIIDSLLTPDLSANGPGASAYRTTFWLAGALVVVMLMIQLGLAVIRRNGKSLALVLLGLGQFVVVWAAWISFGVAVVAACGGLTRALMESLLNVTTWSSWQPWQPITVDDITDGTVATVLGLMGLFLWLAAIAHLLVMITRSAALIVLAAVTPVAAAGLSVRSAGRGCGRACAGLSLPLLRRCRWCWCSASGYKSPPGSRTA